MTLTELTKRRYETGDYGGTHLRMRRADVEWMKSPAPVVPPPAWMPTVPDPFSQLMAIPVVFDDDVPAGTWRLVDNTTGALVEDGTVSA